MLIPGESWRFLTAERRAYSPKDLEAEARSLQTEYNSTAPGLHAKQSVVKKLEDLDKRMRTWILVLDPSYMKQYDVKLVDVKNRLQKMLFQIPADLQKKADEIVVITRTHERPSVVIVRYQAQLYTNLERQLPVWRYIIDESKIGNVWLIKVDANVSFPIVNSIVNILKAIGWDVIEPLPKPHPVLPVGLTVTVPRKPYEIRVKSSQTVSPTTHLNQIFPQFAKDYTPKELTPEQIEDIVSAVPFPISSSDALKNKIRSEIQQHLREDFKGAKLTAIGIEDVKNEIKRRYNRAIVQDGDTVGLRAADALGQPLMQMTLNSVDYEEKLLLQTTDGPKVIKIGVWIDLLLKEHEGRVQSIPENRTEYLELESPVMILSCDFDGNVSWRNISAVTRHLPVGKLVKITTQSGRTVTATRQKSFLVYDEVSKKIVPANGSDLKIGFKVPVSKSIVHLQVSPESIINIEEVESTTPYVYDLTVPDTKTFMIHSGIHCMDTFHVAGSSKNASSGIQAFDELLSIRKERKLINSTIHFVNKDLTFEDVANMEGAIVYLTIASLLLNTELERPDELIQYWWRDAYLATMGKDLPESTWVLRLYLDPVKLYRYKIDMDLLVNLLEDQVPASITCVRSPIDQAIIDIYPDDRLLIRELKKRKIPIPETNASVKFLDAIVKPQLNKIEISGIPGVERLFPTAGSRIWQIVLEENLTYSIAEIENQRKREIDKKTKVGEADRMARRWNLILNRFRMKNTGIPIEKLTSLLRIANISIIHQTETYVQVEMPATLPEVLLVGENKKPTKDRRTFSKPSEYIGALIEYDESQALKAEEEAKKRREITYIHPPTALLRAANYHYAETNGGNLQALLAHEAIDPRYTITNNFYEIYNTLGIEALRNYLIKEFIENISGDGSIYVDPRHIILQVDMMTNRGIPHPVAYKGINTQQGGTMSKMTFERNAQQALEGALYGNNMEPIGVAVGIMVGAPIPSGTGLPQVRSTPEYNERLAKFKADLKNKKATVTGRETTASIMKEERYVLQQFAENEEQAQLLEMFGQARPVQKPEVPSAPVAKLSPAAGPVENAALVKSTPVVSNMLRQAANNVPSIPVYPAPTTTIEQQQIGMNPAKASKLQAMADDKKAAEVSKGEREKEKVPTRFRGRKPEIAEESFVEEL